MLGNCNALSASRLKTVVPEFKKHIHLLADMKKYLDFIFKEVHVMKTKLNTQYSEAFAEAVRSSFAEECEKDVKTKQESSTSNRRRLHIKSEVAAESMNSARRASK
nr:unnamed protein product [Callosobruchus chinensis]